MANILLRRQALELRKLGKSYSQIRSELKISKSTLSDWLKKYPLTQDQLRLLRDDEARIEKYRYTMRTKRENKLQIYYEEAKKALLPLTKRELLIAGLFLYWGEGSKTERGQLRISNTDPSVLKFSLYWMREGLYIPTEKIQVLLHLYDDMQIEEEISYWSKTLNIPQSQFVKPYIKRSNRTEMDEKGYGHGTCNLRVLSTVIKEKIVMSLKVVSDYSEKYIEKF